MKKVSCVDCGFFCWTVKNTMTVNHPIIRYEELFDGWRKSESSDNLKGRIEVECSIECKEISCLRNQWLFSNNIVEDKKMVKNSRMCVYYVKYQPGFGPEEHKELLREEKTNRTIINATLIGAGIGATAAIIAQLVYAMATR